MTLAHRAIGMLHPVLFGSVAAAFILGITSDLRDLMAMVACSGLTALVLFGALPLAVIKWRP